MTHRRCYPHVTHIRSQAARASKHGSAEAQAGLLAVEGLHRQVGTSACAAGTLCAPNLPAMMRGCAAASCLLAGLRAAALFMCCP